MPRCTDPALQSARSPNVLYAASSAACSSLQESQLADSRQHRQQPRSANPFTAAAVSQQCADSVTIDIGQHDDSSSLCEQQTPSGVVDDVPTAALYALQDETAAGHRQSAAAMQHLHPCAPQPASQATVNILVPARHTEMSPLSGPDASSSVCTTVPACQQATSPAIDAVALGTTNPSTDGCSGSSLSAPSLSTRPGRSSDVAAPGAGSEPSSAHASSSAAAAAAAAMARPAATSTTAQAGGEECAEQSSPEWPSAGTAASSSNLLDLLAGKGDVYACAVRGMLRCQPRRALHMYLAMLMIFFVQVALLAMLMQAAQNNGTKVQASDSDLLQVQAKVMQLQLCQLHQALNSSSTTVADKAGRLDGNWDNCSCLLGASEEGNCDAAGRWFADALQAAYSSGITPPYLPVDTVGLSELRVLTSDDQKLKLLLIMLLSMGVLSVFVIREAMQAMQLAYAVAASAGVLPVHFIAPTHRGERVPVCMRKWRVFLAYPIPWFQATVAVLAFCTAGRILALPAFLEDITQFIINSVALAFVIEIDDKAGDVLTWVLDSCWVDPHPRSRLLAGHSVGDQPLYDDFGPCSDFKPKRPPTTAHQPGVPALYMGAGCRILWELLRIPLVLSTGALMVLAQVFSYNIYEQTLWNGGTLPADASEAWNSQLAGWCYQLGPMLLVLLFLVLLTDQPMIVPRCGDGDDWLDSYVNGYTVDTLVGPTSYMALGRACVKTVWSWYLRLPLYTMAMKAAGLLSTSHSHVNSRRQSIRQITYLIVCVVGPAISCIVCLLAPHSVAECLAGKINTFWRCRVWQVTDMPKQVVLWYARQFAGKPLHVKGLLMVISVPLAPLVLAATAFLFMCCCAYGVVLIWVEIFMGIPGAWLYARLWLARNLQRAWCNLRLKLSRLAASS